MNDFGIEELRILLTATFKILDANKPEELKNTYGTELIFINLFIESVLDKVLNDDKMKNKSKTEQFEYVKNNFLRFKVCTQMAIAQAFQSSMERFSKISVDYYCVIKSAQESNSKVSH